MKIAIIGYGKMGHMIEDVARSRGHEITCVIDTNPTPGEFYDRPLDARSSGALHPSREGAKYYTPDEGFQSEAFRSADVAIEFTTPATAKDNILRAWAQGVPVVCGTTGWIENLSPTLSSREGELGGRKGEWKIEESSNKVIVKDETGKVMLVWSSNYSVGVNIFFELNKFLAEQMKNLTPMEFYDRPQDARSSRALHSSREGEKSEGYTPSIKEIHHIHKLDKPSGTAKTLAEQIRETDLSRYRDIEDIEIESVREGEVPGTHEVTWDSEEDTIVITHIAKGRRGFALGAVLAAEEIVG